MVPKMADAKRTTSYFLGPTFLGPKLKNTSFFVTLGAYNMFKKYARRVKTRGLSDKKKRSKMVYAQ